jgi:hypothetical protein
VKARSTSPTLRRKRRLRRTRKRRESRWKLMRRTRRRRRPLRRARPSRWRWTTSPWRIRKRNTSLKIRSWKKSQKSSRSLRNSKSLPSLKRISPPNRRKKSKRLDLKSLELTNWRTWQMYRTGAMT